MQIGRVNRIPIAGSDEGQVKVVGLVPFPDSCAAAKCVCGLQGFLSRFRIRSGARSEAAAVKQAVALDVAGDMSVILVLNQYKCIGCSPGKHPDTRTMAIGSDDDSLDNVRDRCLCIAV